MLSLVTFITTSTDSYNPTWEKNMNTAMIRDRSQVNFEGFVEGSLRKRIQVRVSWMDFLEREFEQ